MNLRINCWFKFNKSLEGLAICADHLLADYLLADYPIAHHLLADHLLAEALVYPAMQKSIGKDMI